MNNLAYYNSLRSELNALHGKLRSMPTEYKLGYRHNVPSILNAYREADILFNDACELLCMRHSLKEEEPIDEQ